MSFRLAATFFLAASLAHAIITPVHDDHVESKRLPGKWYHEEDHPAYSLFRRGGNNDGVSYAPIGTAAWSQGFPPDNASTTNMPEAWTSALNAAVAAGKIPDIPPSTSIAGQDPTYPEGYDPVGPQVCSSTYKCAAKDDVWNAPDGFIGISFDDGPLPPSSVLYDFLAKNNERATHFFIGTNILQYPALFDIAHSRNQDDIALHTWTHPYMTTKTNTELLAEFGWTMWLIHNSTGGRLPRYWRPPYGDSDMRVRAIAKEIFGLTTVIWNQDTDDWSLSEPMPRTTPEKIATQMQTWLTGVKSPGLVILEHELSDLSVKSFIDAYPLMVANGWTRMSLAQIEGLGAYQNAFNSTSPVTPAQVGQINVKPPPASTAQHSTVKPSGSGSGSASSAGPSGSPHANQKSGASHYGTASMVLSGLVAVMAAAAGSIIS
ncbi:carbohydrate esterase family 4 protein [Phlebopus sp. FC_14]|nr:carbohydrate esterase family 4 protein [Phlebopus sp. FC_14]